MGLECDYTFETLGLSLDRRAVNW